MRWEIKGTLPERGAFIVAPNHTSEVDPLLMGMAVWKLGRAPRFMAADRLFRVKGLGWILRKSGQIPVSRDARGANQAAIASAQQLARLGQGVIIYPEGTLTREPNLWPMRGKNGAARVALSADIPVYPTAIWGAQNILPRYAKKPTLGWRTKITVHVGEPVSLTEFTGRMHSASAMKGATELVMHDVTRLLEGIRGEEAPAELYDPAKHGQSEHGKFPQDRGGSSREAGGA
ncbi:1-acyl-sn-glycerol-3-phosphate acyltransferase [Pseudoclavibacter sp. RFBJ3]|nr:1-acyl-sn-glycerol-3-phosphate acyltransferase [Pseudoclavibacter sp. VKM Ac-2888]PPF37687.1 1-acyl-sn-glycerol-3-phosphate acyltransferase [Pseudoclavibacter sp. AY1H1]PPF77298.1 1-acyl-sn-glycerol-3-phosphate acyltransferase [Pseudoclavibacter sp. Z016]PPF81061.1 1-acyl-sn-glycerol-3-phosphate acyltransferase [Pseudoclavibacter sp. RFBJ5]PPF94567.1 1-acyl-sn-glycerol-3-phosphate acyltransferase [Pseudoclavibacter sp. RFBJ3]PPF99676.1 1-acyl-sn-glycerol-3-phosphate acyltransferase [Pseudoc